MDWFYTLEDLKTTAKFRSLFGSNLADYLGLLVVGRDGHLSRDMRERLRWRSLNTQLGGKHIYCVTFDELFKTLSDRVTLVT